MNETSSYLQTVGRALEILELIGRFPGLTLSELARRTGMNTTVIYRLLFTLSTVGFLQQDPAENGIIWETRPCCWGYKVWTTGKSNELLNITCGTTMSVPGTPVS